MNIAVIGIGYVGMANAILLSQYNDVIAYDIQKEKIEKLNKRKLPVVDQDAEEFLQTHELRLKATENLQEALDQANYVVIADRKSVV